MKRTFFNPIEYRSRAGRRTLIYLLAFLAVAALAGLALKPFIPYPISRSLIAVLAISALALGTL